LQALDLLTIVLVNLPFAANWLSVSFGGVACLDF
jgi:hypothetical protein